MLATEEDVDFNRVLCHTSGGMSPRLIYWFQFHLFDQKIEIRKWFHIKEKGKWHTRESLTQDAARLFRRPITSTVGWGHWLQIFYSRIIGCHPGVTLGLTSAPIHLWQQSPRSLLVKWQKACGPKMIWEKSSFWLKILAEIASLPFLSFCKFA